VSLAEELPTVPVIVDLPLRNALTVKVAVVEPAETVTLFGTLATNPLLDDKLTESPPLGAGTPNVTVAVEVAPGDTLSGFSTNEATFGVVTVRVAVRELLL
jgi:hypothetical protein